MLPPYMSTMYRSYQLFQWNENGKVEVWFRDEFIETVGTWDEAKKTVDAYHDSVK